MSGAENAFGCFVIPALAGPIIFLVKSPDRALYWQKNSVAADVNNAQFKKSNFVEDLVMSKSLFERRIALHLTTTDVGARTGLSRQTVRNYERNRGNYVAQKHQLLTDLYQRLESKAVKTAEETQDGRV